MQRRLGPPLGPVNAEPMRTYLEIVLRLAGFVWRGKQQGWLEIVKSNVCGMQNASRQQKSEAAPWHVATVQNESERERERSVGERKERLSRREEVRIEKEILRQRRRPEHLISLWRVWVWINEPINLNFSLCNNSFCRIILCRFIAGGKTYHSNSGENLCKALCRSRRPTVSESKEKTFSRGTAVRSDHRSHHRSQTGTIYRSQHMIHSRSFSISAVWIYICTYIHTTYIHTVTTTLPPETALHGLLLDECASLQETPLIGTRNNEHCPITIRHFDYRHDTGLFEV